ncbi:MAG: OsmC family peroxiredoxin [Candidatus Limnocylindrus sp.]|jgi:osmotically inducible protein OsmC
MTTRTATAVWNGTLLEGSGAITSFESGAIGRLPVSWPRRSEAHGGATSPEELLAAAHASCFAMALSGGLARNNTPAKHLDVSATVTFEKVEAGWRVTKSALTLRGEVPGLDYDKFAELAEAAKGGCPISAALAGNVEITLSIPD